MISNALGVANPVAELVAAAREVGAIVVLDASQVVGHRPFDVREFDCDFACFSAHKMLGPSGVGVLYQSETSPVKVAPVWLGGEMVHEVHAADYEARPFPWAMEAGTPNIEGVTGAGVAAEYLLDVGPDQIHTHCAGLVASIKDVIQRVDGFELVTPLAAEGTSIVTFRSVDAGAHSISRILSNRFNVMVRSGFHCAQPFHELLDSAETLRASVHLYSNQDDVEQLEEALRATAAGRA